MRRLFKVSELRSLGFSKDAIQWGARRGGWRMIVRGVYGEGPADPTEFDRARAVLVVTGGAASGAMAGALLSLDAVEFRGLDFTVAPSQGNRRPGRVRRRDLPPERVIEIEGVRCTDGLQTLVDLATEVDDRTWEAAVEAAVRRGLTSVAELERAAGGSQRGVTRMRRVLGSRPPGAPPTDSLLETRMVQLARTVRGLPAPERQVKVVDRYGGLVARTDLAWPQLGLFVELDGQHHRHQPVYDARRETAIVAATGWLCGRFTWREVVHLPTVTAKRLAALVEQARRRPLLP